MLENYKNVNKQKNFVISLLVKIKQICKTSKKRTPSAFTSLMP